jgi:coproporphyrinogen III oxidase-like Fe-S oxidoreductase
MKPETVAPCSTASPRTGRSPTGIEMTLEANPSSVEAERFRGYRAAGVNRVSLGVQALNDRDLRFLGRLHNVEEALHAIGWRATSFRACPST